MIPAPRCPQCGADLPGDALEGLCPACIGKVVFGPAGAAPAVPVSEKPGDRIGRYILREKIGEGGCGIVYVAEQEEPVRRKVALKIIKLGMDTKEVIARFEAERQALALMDHPNIARVYDGGATGESQISNPKSETPKLSTLNSHLPSGRPYFVMELVRGTKITEFCDQNQLPTVERLKLFIQVCHAIQHAHQKGIIHRDIKPSNVLVSRHDDVPVPKVIDFGIAKAIGERLTDKTLYTSYDQFLGTPAYMSPEQAGWSDLDIDTRSDIYALGVLLYELLAGKPPFDARELLKAGLDELLRTIREKEPMRPSTRLLRERTAARGRLKSQISDLRFEIHADLDWIVMKCLEKNRARRYETASALAQDIEHHLNNQPVTARPPSTVYRVQKFVRRNKLMVTAGAMVATALVLGITISTWQAVRATLAEREQSRLRQDAQVQRQRTEGSERAARHRAYASDMNLVALALAANNLGRARELLQRHVPEPGQKDLRGWEWRYLWQQCQSDALVKLCQKTNSIVSLSVSHDGKWLAIGEEEHGGLSIWDLERRQVVTDLPAGEVAVCAAFSPGELLLAFSLETGVQGQTDYRSAVRLWRGDTRQVVAELPLQGRCIRLAFSQDGASLVTATRGEDRLTLWRVPEGTKVADWPAKAGHKPGMPGFAVDRDCTVAAVANGDFRLIDLSTGRERWRAKAGNGFFPSLAFSPDGEVLAAAEGIVDSSVRFWQVATGKELGRPLTDHRVWVGDMLFFPDGKTMASASGD